MKISSQKDSWFSYNMWDCFFLLFWSVFFSNITCVLQVKCWQIRRQTKAPQAAGTIHTDFERGFICAEVLPLFTLSLSGRWFCLCLLISSYFTARIVIDSNIMMTCGCLLLLLLTHVSLQIPVVGYSYTVNIFFCKIQSKRYQNFLMVNHFIFTRCSGWHTFSHEIWSLFLHLSISVSIVIHYLWFLYSIYMHMCCACLHVYWHSRVLKYVS